MVRVYLGLSVAHAFCGVREVVIKSRPLLRLFATPPCRLTSKSDKEIARLMNENKEMEQKILRLQQQLQAEKRVYGDLQEKLKIQQVRLCDDPSAARHHAHL